MVDYQSADEEEEIFYEAPEPHLEHEILTQQTDVAAAHAPQPAQVLEQERRLSPLTAQEIPDNNVSEETTEQSQVIVDLGRVEQEALAPSLVSQCA